MSEPNTWGCCREECSPDDNFIICAKCKMAFHFSCLSVTSIDITSDWNCPNCKTHTPRTTRTDCTPLRNISISRGSKRPALNSPSPPGATNNQDDLKSTIQELLRIEFNNLLKQFNDSLKVAISQELVPIKQEMKDINESMSFINQKFEEMKTEQEASIKKVKNLEVENEKLKQTVGNLGTRIDYLEQQSRSSNLEIQCVPEKKQENLYTIITQLAKTVDYEIKNVDILHCTRTAKITASSSRPRSIIIKLASPRVRDELLACVIKYNKSNPEKRLCSDHLGITGPKSPVYVVEHLSPSNKALHAATRIKAKEMCYKYVWVRNGKIFVRKCETSDYILIKNMDTLNKLI
ncbi:unnamed protein product [Euphydryas editha]|uniref:PHD-type domain-containing protein n=1 Tax=Euphydryas editha TaxID=104508 RepID=A0AAU9V491_EUPED|nr:unnamed protein product [Euphydryas editha]